MGQRRYTTREGGAGGTGVEESSSGRAVEGSCEGRDPKSSWRQLEGRGPSYEAGRRAEGGRTGRQVCMLKYLNGVFMGSWSGRF